MATDNISTLQHLYGAFGQGDIDTVVAGCTPDVRWESNGDRAAYPTFGRFDGPEAVRSFFAHLAGELDFDAFSPNEFHPSGDKVFVLGHSRMTVKKTRRPVEFDWVHVFTFRDGKVSAFHDFVDTHQIVEANRAA
jgi:ketosteroid isomerase-like protein